MVAQIAFGIHGQHFPEESLIQYSNKQRMPLLQNQACSDESMFFVSGEIQNRSFCIPIGNTYIGQSIA
jgi:hypothetical protein